MKILVLSNSNGNSKQIESAISISNPNAIFHLGNGIRDLSNLRIEVPLYLTKGKKDFFIKAEPIKKFNVQNISILLTYGHKFGTQHSILNLEKLAHKEHANVMLFGCGKKFYYEKDGVTYINPGKIYKNDGNCVLLEIENGKINCIDINLTKMC